MSLLNTTVWNPASNKRIVINDSKWIHFNGSYGDIFCAASIIGNSEALKTNMFPHVTTVDTTFETKQTNRRYEYIIKKFRKR